MSGTLAMRATSLGAAAASMGALLILALSITYTVQRFPINEPRGIETVLIEPPPVEPPKPIVRAPPVTDLPDLTPVAPLEFDAGEPTTPSEIAFAQPQIAGPVVVNDPHWLRRPSSLARYYPPRAVSRGVDGVVILDCLVDVHGRLGCAVASETPSNWGFGAAAMRISRDYQMVPAMRDGVAVEARYRMRVPFNLE